MRRKLSGAEVLQSISLDRELSAPALDLPFGNNAKEALSGIVFCESVTLSCAGRDRYGRTIGTVF
jgi:hypothetical protein